MDRQTLAALALGNAETKVEHKTVAATAHAPAHTVETCTITPRIGASSSLSVTVVAHPGGVAPARPMCSDRVEGKIGMGFCSAVIQHNMVNVSLVSRTTTFAAMNAPKAVDASTALLSGLSDTERVWRL
ncbi:MAG: hypothetical protein JF619_06145 [Massilia sp.]|nr:hypothetical protein [Massilia sp.]